MAGRGSQSFMKRQKEQQRKERQQEKFAKRMQRKHEPKGAEEDDLTPLTPESSTTISEQPQES